ncbi:GDP-mannose 4,6-dehydratase [Paraconexibacter antarcticus]|uniref:GDP-mannose 4,6-dehydratase n=1 Tax=Paraconexibacter antarcticus TaxID=2949664 RepID=A0ABY5DVT4_9ACTN|nr:GDP-mannose 4,6-dehydratase [Paraconexibacter antarcticus]UTI65039.1 GDP-mannose 4,6-dehydratase [Paraconexibacter antarcticus]
MAGPRALITGIGGQDGSYLAESLLDDGFEVIGMLRDPGDLELRNLAGVRHRCAFVPGDLEDPPSLRRAVADARPDLVFHLAAPTFVPDSWTDPTATLAAIAGGTSTLLAAVAASLPETRIVVVSSAEIFGDSGESPQDERSPMRPRSPYGVAKLAAHGLVGTMRAKHGIHASSAITFNHESPRRPVQFLPRKVTRGVAEIKLGLAEELVLGDLTASRDWCDARDVVRGLRLMAAANQADDYVLASGVPRTVQDLVDTAFACASMSGEGRIRVDEQFVREPEGTQPLGRPEKALRVLGWAPEIPFEQTVNDMLDADLADLAGR